MSAGEVILITGTSSGFGRLMAETCARKGYTVYASMRHTTRRNAAASAAFRVLAEQEGLPLHVIELDVTDDTSVERAVQEVIERTGRIDVLVNNAGFNYIGLNEACTLADVHRQFDTNFFGVVRMNRAVLPHMRRQGRGLLIYMSSAVGRVIAPFLGIYAASKFALEALAESYHYQLYGLGIDSVIIEPSRYATAAPSNMLQPSDPARSAGYGQVAAVFEQVAADFLASFSSAGVPAPQEVVDAVVELIAMPPGKRPLRVPLGAMVEPLDQLNLAMARVQTGLIERFGLTRIMQRSSRESHEE